MKRLRKKHPEAVVKYGHIYLLKKGRTMDSSDDHEVGDVRISYNVWDSRAHSFGFEGRQKGRSIEILDPSLDGGISYCDCSRYCDAPSLCEAR